MKCKLGKFIATVFDPENGVGGCINNAIDLVANLIGATTAMGILYFSERRPSPAHNQTKKLQ